LGRAAYNHRVSERFATPINGTTRFCAVFGHPVQHSASPAMQNAGLAALGLNWRYLACDVRPDDLRQAIAGAKAMRFIGLNLTVPHKVLALDLVDNLHPSAKDYGAVNTIVFEGRDHAGAWRPLGQLGKETAEEVRSHGYNTDADAITRAVHEDLSMELCGAKVVLLGAGGAGRVAALKLASEGVAELFLVNRTLQKAEALAAEITARFPGLNATAGYPGHKVTLLINATSLGLKSDDPLPLDATRFSLAQAESVYDMIYRPAETPLLKAARGAGCRTANGSGMLLYQGVKALELWCGQNPPIHLMRDALNENIYGR
jgi:shikimate dehydrogenase